MVIITLPECTLYKLKSGVWTRLPDLKYGRHAHSCAVMGGQLFSIGGHEVLTQVWKLCQSPLRCGVSAHHFLLITIGARLFNSRCCL